MIGKLKVATVACILILVATIIVIGLRMVGEREVVFEPEGVKAEELVVEPAERSPRIEDVEFEKIEPEEVVGPSREVRKEVGLGELPLDEMVIPPEAEEAEVIPLAPKAPVKRGHDIEPGPEDLRKLRESGAIIY